MTDSIHAIHFPLDEDRTRQEFAKDADINVLLRRHGGIPAGRQPTYGPYDFDLDMQDALEATRKAQEAFNNLAPDLRRRHPTWPSLIRALDNGSLVIKHGKIGPPDPSPPAAPAPTL